MWMSKADAISSWHGAKSWSVMSKRPLYSGRRRANRRSLSPSFDRFCIVLKTAFGHRRRREVTFAGEICCDHQVGDAARFSTTISWKLFVAMFESGNINRSSHGNDHGSIRVSGFFVSGESDKSKSTTPSEHKSFESDLSLSWDTRILWWCSIWGVYMCLGYTPDGIVLVSGYCVTCLDLLFSKPSRTRSIFRRKVADHAHWCAGLTADKDVGHVGKCPRSRTLGAVWPPTRIQDISIELVGGFWGHGLR